MYDSVKIVLIRHLKITFNPSTSVLTFIADKIDLLDIFDKCTSARAIIVQAICNIDQNSMIFHLTDERATL